MFPISTDVIEALGKLAILESPVLKEQYQKVVKSLPFGTQRRIVGKQRAERKLGRITNHKQCQ